LNVPHNSSLISDKVTMSLGVATANWDKLSENSTRFLPFSLAL
jgi:hypothetical protein